MQLCVLQFLLRKFGCVSKLEPLRDPPKSRALEKVFPPLSPCIVFPPSMHRRFCCPLVAKISLARIVRSFAAAMLHRKREKAIKQRLAFAAINRRRRRRPNKKGEEESPFAIWRGYRKGPTTTGRRQFLSSLSLPFVDFATVSPLPLLHRHHNATGLPLLRRGGGAQSGDSEGKEAWKQGEEWRQHEVEIPPLFSRPVYSTST